jgi:hypothetical protein
MNLTPGGGKLIPGKTGFAPKAESELDHGGLPEEDARESG